jgi:hypothetical protein
MLTCVELSVLPTTSRMLPNCCCNEDETDGVQKDVGDGRPSHSLYDILLLLVRDVEASLCSLVGTSQQLRRLFFDRESCEQPEDVGLIHKLSLRNSSFLVLRVELLGPDDDDDDDDTETVRFCVLVGVVVDVRDEDSNEAVVVVWICFLRTYDDASDFLVLCMVKTDFSSVTKKSSVRAEDDVDIVATGVVT